MWNIVSGDKMVFFTIYYSLLFFNYLCNLNNEYLNQYVTIIIKYNNLLFFLVLICIAMGTVLKYLVSRFNYGFKINNEHVDNSKAIKLLIGANMLDNIGIILLLIVMPFINHTNFIVVFLSRY